MPKKLNCSVISAFLLFCIAGFAYADESLTITTYYPSPYGVYNQLQANSLGVGDNNNNGTLDSGDVPTTPGDVWIKGKVGIGTVPSYKFDVVDNSANFAAHIKQNSSSGYGLVIHPGNDSLHALGILNTAGTVWEHVFYGNGNAVLAVGGGSVGIGTASPAYKLDVVDNSANFAAHIKQNSSSGYGLVIHPGNDSLHALGILNTAGTAWEHVFYGNGNVLLAADSGNVGIGTASPASKLSVGGEISSTGGPLAQFRAVGGNYGVMLRNDGNTTFLLVTNPGDPYGAWNGLRPFYLNNSTGDVTIGKLCLGGVCKSSWSSYVKSTGGGCAYRRQRVYAYCDYWQNGERATGGGCTNTTGDTNYPTMLDQPIISGDQAIGWECYNNGCIEAFVICSRA